MKSFTAVHVHVHVPGTLSDILLKKIAMKSNGKATASRIVN